MIFKIGGAKAFTRMVYANKNQSLKKQYISIEMAQENGVCDNTKYPRIQKPGNLEKEINGLLPSETERLMKKEKRI